MGSSEERALIKFKWVFCRDILGATLLFKKFRRKPGPQRKFTQLLGFSHFFLQLAKFYFLGRRVSPRRIVVFPGVSDTFPPLHSAFSLKKQGRDLITTHNAVHLKYAYASIGSQFTSRRCLALLLCRAFAPLKKNLHCRGQ